ncbi:hypothetical protein [Hypericibacter sp.]|uniref:hypothetical protein n=1 Tax=Hypericibacter sp. TaxID=2705401 RepID=UPI003D6D6D8B
MSSPATDTLRDLREPKRLYGAVLFMRRRGHVITRLRKGKHYIDDMIGDDAWLLGLAVAEGYERPDHPALRDQAGRWIACPFCGEADPELKVHGHTQCKRCGQVIERCCDV